jgi:hypothetical protein
LDNVFRGSRLGVQMRRQLRLCNNLKRDQAIHRQPKLLLRGYAIWKPPHEAVEQARKV